MKTIILDELTQPIFYYEGKKWTAIAPAGTRLIAKDDSGNEMQFSVYTEVQVEVVFTTKSTLDAFMHLEHFKNFALKRMTQLYYMLDNNDNDREFYKNSSKSVEFYETYDESVFKINFLYGFENSGSYDGELIDLDLITVSTDEWAAYCTARLAQKLQKEADQKALNEQKRNSDQYNEYLKLRAKFEAKHAPTDG